MKATPLGTNPEFAPKTFRGAKGKLLFYILAAAIVSWVGGFIVSRNEPLAFFLGGLILGIAGVYGLVLVILLFRNGPRLVLDQTGLYFVGPWQNRRWEWDQTGPFCLDQNTYRSGIWRSRAYFACAFLYHHHSALQTRAGSVPEPDTVTADIKIPISLLAGVKKEADAEAVVNELNDWRNRYVPSEVPKEDTTPSETETNFEDKLKRRRMWFWISIGASLLIPIAAFILVMSRNG